MYVNNNSAALNSWLNLNNTTTSMTETLAQLSSGYKINSAGDNPAGLAIAQNMQAQSQALSQGSSNAQSGISLLQTADGGMNQIQNILQSMYQLATQAASGTVNSTDTAAIQQEMSQYATEITQITNTTSFNGLNLLSNALTNTQIQFGQNGTITGTSNSLKVSLSANDAFTLNLTGRTGTLAAVAGSASTAGTSNLAVGENTLSTSAAIAGNNLSNGTYSIGSTFTGFGVGTFSKSAHVNGVKFASGSYTGNTNTTYNVKLLTDTASTVTSASYQVNGGSWQVAALSGASTTNASMTIGGVKMKAVLAATTIASDTFTIQLTPQKTAFSFYTAASAAGTPSTTTTLTGAQSGATLSLTQGSNTLFTDTNVTTKQTAITSLTGSVAASTAYGGTMHAYHNYTVAQSGQNATGSNGTLSVAAVASTALNITTQANAVTAMSQINTAINTVSTNRGNIGALMNRLQFAYNDNQVTSQNVTNARAGIMDTDMAMQMANLAQQQVLQQSGVAMLAQATQLPQALLKLLT